VTTYTGIPVVVDRIISISDPLIIHRLQRTLIGRTGTRTAQLLITVRHMQVGVAAAAVLGPNIPCQEIVQRTSASRNSNNNSQLNAGRTFAPRVKCPRTAAHSSLTTPDIGVRAGTTGEGLHPPCMCRAKPSFFGQTLNFSGGSQQPKVKNCIC